MGDLRNQPLEDSHVDDLGTSEVATRVVEIIGRYAESDRELRMDDRLDDLRIDSLALMELAFELEEAFDIQIEINANRAEEHRGDWQDVASAIATVERMVRARGSTPE